MRPRLIIKTSLRDRPKEHETSAAMLLMDYFKSDVVFLRPLCQKTPDLEINGKTWELKSPKGDGKNTIKNNLHDAREQSVNVIVDLRRIKMSQDKALSRIDYYFKSHRSKIKHLMIILKNGKILEKF